MPLAPKAGGLTSSTELDGASIVASGIGFGGSNFGPHEIPQLGH